MHFEYLNSTTKSVTQHCNNQIYACNPIGPAEKDLLWYKLALKILFIFDHKISQAVLEGSELGGQDQVSVTEN